MIDIPTVLSPLPEQRPKGMVGHSWSPTWLRLGELWFSVVDSRRRYYAGDRAIDSRIEDGKAEMECLLERVKAPRYLRTLFREHWMHERRVTPRDGWETTCYYGGAHVSSARYALSDAITELVKLVRDGHLEKGLLRVVCLRVAVQAEYMVRLASANQHELKKLDEDRRLMRLKPSGQALLAAKVLVGLLAASLDRSEAAALCP